MGVDPMSATFHALASPVRRTIPMRLAATDALVGELGKLFDTSLPAISKHLDVLERVGHAKEGSEVSKSKSGRVPDQRRS